MASVSVVGGSQRTQDEGQTLSPMRLLIVDGYELVRAGLRSMLAGEPGLAVVGEAATGEEAMLLCRRLQPDIVMMDLWLPTLDGVPMPQAIKREFPAISIVIVTACDDPECLFEALMVGAAGFLLKSATRQQFVSTLQHVLRGEVVLNHTQMVGLITRLSVQSPQPNGLKTPSLTPRELAVVRLLAQGRTNREIAQGLGVTISTVKVHVEHIIAKFGASDRTEAAVRALEFGFIAPTGNGVGYSDGTLGQLAGQRDPQAGKTPVRSLAGRRIDRRAM
jgi:DNA-binding NarL/FixJ family response regulator